MMQHQFPLFVGGMKNPVGIHRSTDYLFFFNHSSNIYNEDDDETIEDEEDYIQNNNFDNKNKNNSRKARNTKFNKNSKILAKFQKSIDLVKI